MGPCQRVPGKIDALGVQARVHGQGAQQPFPAATAEVQGTPGAAENPGFEQPANGGIAERRRYRVIGVGKHGYLFAVHRRSLTRPGVTCTCGQPSVPMHGVWQAISTPSPPVVQPYDTGPACAGG